MIDRPSSHENTIHCGNGYRTDKFSLSWDFLAAGVWQVFLKLDWAASLVMTQ